MVALPTVRTSNALLSTKVPGLVAVFVGATSGIGECSLKAFAKHTRKPRTYFIGRSQEAGDRIRAECQAINPQGEFIFMKVDTSLIRNVDKACAEIKAKENTINILFLSTGTFARTSTFDPILMEGLRLSLADVYVATEEGLLTAISLAYYSRTRFITNLLTLLQSAPSLRRVVSVFCGTKEGPLDPNDFGCKNAPVFPPLAARGRAASLVTLGLEAVAKQAPTVSFLHIFPGAVKTNIARDMKGFMGLVVSGVFNFVGKYVEPEEVGERHLFFATSAMYESSEEKENGILGEGVSIARGTDGIVGSGVYSVQQNCESADVEVEKLLARFRKEGLVEKVWEHTEAEFKRIAEE
jgi:NAD(P)-dependent dehydrogenase (short-subunit alcohol dehydrogenase family)